MSTHVAMSSSCLFLGSMPEVFRTASELGYDSVEVLVTLRDRQWGEALLLTAGSVLAGLLVAAGGYALGLADG